MKKKKGGELSPPVGWLGLAPLPKSFVPKDASIIAHSYPKRKGKSQFTHRKQKWRESLPATSGEELAPRLEHPNLAVKMFAVYKICSTKAMSHHKKQIGGDLPAFRWTFTPARRAIPFQERRHCTKFSDVCAG